MALARLANAEPLLVQMQSAGAAFESHRKIEKSFSNSFLVFWVWADTPSFPGTMFKDHRDNP